MNFNCTFLYIITLKQSEHAHSDYDFFSCIEVNEKNQCQIVSTFWLFTIAFPILQQQS